MKFDELLEAPQGFGSTLKTAAKAINPFSLSGRSKAQGQFGTGLNANKIYGEYYKWLGSTGQQPDTDNVLSFLKQKGYGQQAIAAAQANFPEAEPETTTEPQDPTLEPEAPTGKLTPDQVAAAKQKAKSGTARLQNNPNGYKNSRVGTPVQRLSGADASGAPKFQTVRESKLYEGQPLNKEQLSAIFTAVAQTVVTPSKQPSTGAPAGTTAPASTGSVGSASPAPKGNTYGNNTTPNVGTTSQSAPSAPAGSTAEPATSGNDPHPIVQQYIGLDSNGRQAIRQALDQADKTHPPETTDDRIRENVGYSRFLGMQL
jgi:hypothetical protein